jgi:2-phosphosulfolactate phosphatase
MWKGVRVTNVYEQSQARVRMEWGPVGAAAVAAGTDIAVVVDVLSFTTTLSVAVERGAEVFPYRWRDKTAADFARARNATLAVGRYEARHSDGLEQVTLSPRSIRTATGLDRLVLPSPNGSTISFQLAECGARVLGACLRNRTAVARWVADRMVNGGARNVALVAAGERWPDGSLRPAVEDLWGAGAVIAALEDLGVTPYSPEATAAAAAFRSALAAPTDVLFECSSGKELVAAGFGDDVTVAAELDASTCVPALDRGRFVEWARVGA